MDTLKAGPQQGRGHGGRADTSVASSAVSCWRFDEDGLKGRLRPSPSLSGPGTLRGCRLSDTAFRSTFRVSSVRPASRCRTESAFSTSVMRWGAGCPSPGSVCAGACCGAGCMYAIRSCPSLGAAVREHLRARNPALSNPAPSTERGSTRIDRRALRPRQGSRGTRPTHGGTLCLQSVDSVVIEQHENTLQKICTRPGRIFLFWTKSAELNIGWCPGMAVSKTGQGCA